MLEAPYIYIVKAEGVEIVSYLGDISGHLNIPHAIAGLPVTSIRARAFENNKEITAVTIPGSVTSIGESAFEECRMLREVNLNDGLVSIENNAFYYCDINSLVIPASVTTIGNRAFWDNQGGISKVYFLGDAPSIEYGAFDSRWGDRSWFVYSSYASGFSSHRSNIIDPLKLNMLQWYREFVPGKISIPLDTDLMIAYALNGNPLQIGKHLAPQLSMGSNTMELQFYGASAGVTYQVECSTNLIDWTTDGVTITDPDANGMSTATVDAQSQKKFVRLNVGE